MARCLAGPGLPTGLFGTAPLEAQLRPVLRARCAPAAHAYQQTRADLRWRRGSVRATLAHRGMRLDDAGLDDGQRRLLPQPPAARPLQRLGEVPDDLRHYR